MYKKNYFQKNTIVKGRSLILFIRLFNFFNDEEFLFLVRMCLGHYLKKRKSTEGQ